MKVMFRRSKCYLLYDSQRATFPKPQKAQETQKTENRSLARVSMQCLLHCALFSLNTSINADNIF